MAITERSGLYMAPDLSTTGKNLLVLYFNINTGALLPNESKGYNLFSPSVCGGTGIPVPGGSIATGLRGCAFTPNGQGLILTA